MLLEEERMRKEELVDLHEGFAFDGDGVVARLDQEFGEG